MILGLPAKLSTASFKVCLETALPDDWGEQIALRDGKSKPLMVKLQSFVANVAMDIFPHFNTKRSHHSIDVSSSKVEILSNFLAPSRCLKILRALAFEV